MATATAKPNGSAMVQTEDRTMQYVPFASKDSIKLTVAIVQNLICVPTKSGARCNEADALKFMMLCKARGLNPFEGDAFLIGYDSKDKGPTFSLITSHQAFLKRAECHQEYDGMESGLIVRTAEGETVDREGDFFFEGEDGDFILGAWATVYFKNRSHPMKKRVRLATFNTGYSRWKDDPAGMIVKCAESDALRSSFPTLLGGLYSQEESPVPETVTVRADPMPAELPTGRTKVSGTRKPPAPKPEPRHVDQEPPNNTTFADDGADPEPPQDDAQVGDACEGDEADQILASIKASIASATTKNELSNAGKALKEAEGLLGEKAFKEVMKAWQDKYKTMGK